MPAATKDEGLAEFILDTLEDDVSTRNLARAIVERAEGKQAKVDAARQLHQEKQALERRRRELEGNAAPTLDDDLDHLVEWKPRHLELRDRALQILAQLPQDETSAELAGIVNELAEMVPAESSTSVE